MLTNQRFQPGEGPSSSLLRDCETDGALHSTTGYLRRGLAQGQAESELQGGGGPEDTAVTAAGSTATWSWCPSPGKHWPVAPLGPLPLRSQVSTRLLHCKATFVPIKKRLSQFLNLSKIVFSSFRVHWNCFAYHQVYIM